MIFQIYLFIIQLYKIVIRLIFFFSYAIASWAFRWLVDAAQDQCVVLQGISGSGKSHSISMLLHCLCGTNNHNNLLNQRLLNANIILNCKLDCKL